MEDPFLKYYTLRTPFWCAIYIPERCFLMRHIHTGTALSDAPYTGTVLSDAPYTYRNGAFYCAITGADPGGGGVPTPFLVHYVGFLTLGPKLDPSWTPLFSCRPKMDPPPFEKSWIRPCIIMSEGRKRNSKVNIHTVSLYSEKGEFVFISNIMQFSRNVYDPLDCRVQTLSYLIWREAH